MTEYVVLTKRNGGAMTRGFANGGTTTVYNPSHIVRVDANQDDHGRFVAGLHDNSSYDVNIATRGARASQTSAVTAGHGELAQKIKQALDLIDATPDLDDDEQEVGRDAASLVLKGELVLYVDATRVRSARRCRRGS